MINQDRTADYDKAIDALFEGFVGAAWLIRTGRTEGMGLALTDRVKERLVERHGAAADFIVYNTGPYKNGIATRWTDDRPSRVEPTLLARFGRAFLRLLGRSRPEPEPETPPKPRWLQLIRDCETKVDRMEVRRTKVPGWHRPEALH